MIDVNCKPIRIGDRVRHVRHGQIYRVAAAGTDGLLAEVYCLILIPEKLPHKLAWRLTQQRSQKVEVIH